MLHLPIQLTHDLERLRDDSHPASTPSSESPAEIEELVVKAIHLYARLDRQHERWAVPIREGTAAFDLQEGKLWQITFQKWCDDVRQIIQQAKPFEAAGKDIDQLDELRNTLMHCDYNGIDIEDLIRGAAELREGKGIPMAEIENELRRRLEAERSAALPAHATPRRTPLQGARHSIERLAQPS